MPKDQDRSTGMSGTTSSQLNPFTKLGKHLHRHDHTPARSTQTQCHSCNSGHEVKRHCSYIYIWYLDLWRMGKFAHQACHLHAWDPQMSLSGSRINLCIHFHQRLVQKTPHKRKPKHCAPPTDRWTNRTDQSGSWKLPVNVYQLSTDRLAILVTPSHLQVQESDTLHHQTLPLLPYTWIPPVY